MDSLRRTDCKDYKGCTGLPRHRGCMGCTDWLSHTGCKDYRGYTYSLPYTDYKGCRDYTGFPPRRDLPPLTPAWRSPFSDRCPYSALCRTPMPL